MPNRPPEIVPSKTKNIPPRPPNNAPRISPTNVPTKGNVIKTANIFSNLVNY